MIKKLFILPILLFVTAPAFAQVDTAWVRRYNGPGDSLDEGHAIAVDGFKNVYVSGYSYGGSGTDYDYATIKYYPNGDTAWVRRYDGPYNYFDVATAIAIDVFGNAFVTGFSWGIGMDYATIKYYPDGDTGWVRRYNGPENGDDLAFAIAVDSCGNVYVTGYSWNGTNYDYATIKYYPNGGTAWVRAYDGPGNGDDYAHAIAVYGCDNIYVTGHSWGSGTDYDYATIKYDSSGNADWIRRYNGAGNARDEAWDIAVNDSGNVYVTGFSYGSGTDYDYATIKYYPNGDTAWVRRYNGQGNSTDSAGGMAVDGSGNVYVTGYSWGIGTSYDYATIKYDSSGNELWIKRYNGPGNGYDRSGFIAVDASNNVYVTGGSYGNGTSEDYATIKYYPNGDTAWVRRYNGPGNTDDRALDIAVDAIKNIYVTGASSSCESFQDYATIKYVQYEESIMVVFPNGGETLYVDATYDITWSWTYVESVKIEYSTNAGSSWLPITGSTESDGSYSWVVPNTPSENCLVKISDAKDGDPVDMSDGYFTITCEPMLVVKSPNGGECWRIGTAYDITWNHFCFSDNVIIEYTTNNGSTWDTIVATTSNDGVFPWTIPNTPSDSCLIRISDVVDHIPSDTSDKFFSIVTWIRGDANGDGVIDIADVMYLINYLFIGGSAPDPLWVGDCNSDDVVDVADVMYLINYLFLEGSPPGC